MAATKKKASDYKHNYGDEITTVMGGKWKDVPKPYQLYYPRTDGGKRGLSVGVHKYYGVGVHFYASVREADNYVWDSAENVWRRPWDANDGNKLYPSLEGKDFSDKFDTHTEARNFVNKILKREFSPGTHEVTDGSGVGKISDFKWDFVEDFDPNEE
jgi:hypothetical protein